MFVIIMIIPRISAGLDHPLSTHEEPFWIHTYLMYLRKLRN